MFGYEPGELIGKHVTVLNTYPPEENTWIVEGVIEQLKARGRWEGEFSNRRKDGTAFSTHARITALELSGKRYWVYVQADITERKRMEEMLRESQRVSSTLICNLPGMVYRCRNDRDWTVTYLSEGCFALTGYHPSDFTENRITYVQLIHPDDRDIVWDKVQVALRAKKPFAFTYRIKTASGEEKWAWEQGRGVFASNGELLFLEGFITDITERKLAEEALRESKQRMVLLSHRLLEVQEAERRHVARELHDEIGQCLTGFKLGLETALRLEARAAKSTLLSLIDQADSLISKSRELSLDLRPAMLDDMGLLPALLFHFERFTERFGVRVRFEHGGIERRFHPCLETAVFRIVQEALTNVARHSRAEEAMVTITTEEDGLNVQVKDEGVGFDPDKAIASGKAVGLSGIHERAILLGGHCDIESAPGASTQVTVRFSLSKVAEREASGRAQRAEHG